MHATYVRRTKFGQVGSLIRAKLLKLNDELSRMKTVGCIVCRLSRMSYHDNAVRRYMGTWEPAQCTQVPRHPLHVLA